MGRQAGRRAYRPVLKAARVAFALELKEELAPCHVERNMMTSCHGRTRCAPLSTRTRARCSTTRHPRRSVEWSATIGRSRRMQRRQRGTSEPVVFGKELQRAKPPPHNKYKCPDTPRHQAPRKPQPRTGQDSGGPRPAIESRIHRHVQCICAYGACDRANLACSPKMRYSCSQAPCRHARPTLPCPRPAPLCTLPIQTWVPERAVGLNRHTTPAAPAHHFMTRNPP